MPDTNVETLKLFLAGDVMIGRGIDQALPESVPPTLFESYVKDARDYLRLAERKSGNIDTPVDYKYVWGDAIQVFRHHKPDLKLINLETSITTSSEAWPGKGIHYRMHPANVELIKVGGIDHVSLANNHLLDWGRKGLEESLETLRKAGIQFSGAGADQTVAQAPSIFKINNTRILIFSYGAGDSGIPASWSAEKAKSGVSYLSSFGKSQQKQVKQNIQAYSESGDIIIFSVHWGGNWGYMIPEEHRNFAQFLIDQAKVDLVFGHSSHHPKPLEVYKNKLILYGAGDLINDYEGISGHEQYKPWLSIMYFPEIDVETGELISLKMVPMQIRKFSLERASTEETVWLKKVLSRDGKLGSRVQIREDAVLYLEW
ncbi:CapA family protein [Gramella sp. BOM4]|nr:CapA family protein [Christiangramia bathymodioli]